jgi:two-component system response regulator
MHPLAIDVLLIEDNPGDADLTIRELKKHSFVSDILHLPDGEAAMEYLFPGWKPGNKTTESPVQLPRLILLDIRMPKLNGIQVLEYIRQNPATRNIPVIMLTASDDDPDMQACRKLGVSSYIVKPVRAEDYARVIKDLGFEWLFVGV